MFRRLRAALTPSRGLGLAGTFIRLGWAGLWLQVVFGSLPILMTIYYFAFSHPNPNARDEFGFLEFLAVINLLMLLFTTYWSYHYTRIGRRMREPSQSPSESSLISTVWTGVTATMAGMFLSMIAIVIETANLLFYFLKSPQAGIPVIQTSGTGSTHWVSSVDMVSLMALILFLAAEMVVLLFSLWLLFRTTRRSSAPSLSPVPAGEKERAGVGASSNPPFGTFPVPRPGG
jgi:hypothetical protein